MDKMLKGIETIKKKAADNQRIQTTHDDILRQVETTQGKLEIIKHNATNTSRTRRNNNPLSQKGKHNSTTNPEN